MNFDPASLFTVTRALAVEAGLDVDPLDGIVQLGGIKYLSVTGNPPSLKRRDNLYTQVPSQVPAQLRLTCIYSGFNLPTFVQRAFKQLKSDVKLSADVTIGMWLMLMAHT